MTTAELITELRHAGDKFSCCTLNDDDQRHAKLLYAAADELERLKAGFDRVIQVLDDELRAK